MELSEVIKKWLEEEKIKYSFVPVVGGKYKDKAFYLKLEETVTGHQFYDLLVQMSYEYISYEDCKVFSNCDKVTLYFKERFLKG